MPESLSDSSLEQLVTLRRTIHQYPEVSGEEEQTALRLEAFLKKLKPDALYTGLAGHGLAAVFDSGKPGPVILLRSDLDALPIQEVNTFEYRSTRPGSSHKCGHDGHMAILSGVAMLLAAQRPLKGKVVLLYQPEEETGQGAAKILQQEVIRQLDPQWVFALHNLPGFPKKAIIIKEGPFAAASKGMIIDLQGHSSHAAHPEQGNSPAPMMAQLMQRLMELPEQQGVFKSFTLLTLIHARLGEVAFGTNPGQAKVMATLRAFLDEDMQTLTQQAEQLVKSLSAEYNIRAEISYTEVFPATNNHSEAARQIIRAAEATHRQIIPIEEPFRWSEDFGHFTAQYKGALFGLGSGEDHPSLHNHDYDFPDEIIQTGVEVFYQLIRQISGQ